MHDWEVSGRTEAACSTNEEGLVTVPAAAEQAMLCSEVWAASKSALLLLQGLTYVLASSGRLWSTALRMDSSKAEGAAKSVVRCAAAHHLHIGCLLDR